MSLIITSSLLISVHFSAGRHISLQVTYDIETSVRRSHACLSSNHVCRYTRASGLSQVYYWADGLSPNIWAVRRALLDHFHTFHVYHKQVLEKWNIIKHENGKITVSILGQSPRKSTGSISIFFLKLLHEGKIIRGHLRHRDFGMQTPCLSLK